MLLLLVQYLQHYVAQSHRCGALSDAEAPISFASHLLVHHEYIDTDIRMDQVFQTLHSSSYLSQLANVITHWYTTKTNPFISAAHPIDGIEEVRDGSCREQLSLLNWEVVASFVDTIMQYDAYEMIPAFAIEQINAFLIELGCARGLLTLLGFRETVGSRILMPPTRLQCTQAFIRPHRDEKLTVGARAFSKHCHRSSKGTFWGSKYCVGNEATKNAIALSKLNELFDTAVWKNIHSLPHSKATFEVRNEMGYGARWCIENPNAKDEAIVFRGFLEPPMENGHENRWRH